MVSQLTRSTVAIVMAGGRGQRLMQLTDNRAKPATPFGGKYRIIDFSLSNCVNSGIRQIFILTQYKAHSLIQHVQRGWGYLHGELGEFIDIVPAQQQLGEIWYRGTADAVYQNLDIIEQHRPETVLVLAGDHVYKMDYGPMIAFHKESGADITIGGVQVPLSQAHEFGVMALGPDHRVLSFDEKPKDPKPMPGREGVALASMGIYVIGPEFLRTTLERDAADPHSKHDFGRNVIPEAVATRRVFAYPFEDVETKAQRYWRDVGTVDAYYSANMELIYVSPELNLYDEAWPIWTYQEQVPSAKFILDDDRRRGARDQLDGRGRLHRVGRRGARVAAVLARDGRRADGTAPLRRAAARRDRAQLLHRERDHRRVLRHSARDDDRARPRGGRAELSRNRQRRRARHAQHARRAQARVALKGAVLRFGR